MAPVISLRSRQSSRALTRSLTEPRCWIDSGRLSDKQEKQHYRLSQAFTDNVFEHVVRNVPVWPALAVRRDSGGSLEQQGKQFVTTHGVYETAQSARVIIFSHRCESLGSAVKNTFKERWSLFSSVTDYSSWTAASRASWSRMSFVIFVLQ